MARYKEIDRSPRFLPVILDEQLMAGSFEYALDYLVDNALDLSRFDARYNNDGTGAQRDCGSCAMREKCLRHPERTPVRQMVLLKKIQTSSVKFIERMKQAIDSRLGRKLYGQRMATVEPVLSLL